MFEVKFSDADQSFCGMPEIIHSPDLVCCPHSGRVYRRGEDPHRRGVWSRFATMAEIALQHYLWGGAVMPEFLRRWVDARPADVGLYCWAGCRAGLCACDCNARALFSEMTLEEYRLALLTKIVPPPHQPAIGGPIPAIPPAPPPPLDESPLVGGYVTGAMGAPLANPVPEPDDGDEEEKTPPQM